MNRRLKLINWVKAQHEGQLIKETNAPYLDHVLAVANRVASAAPLTFEIGLCHDLLEKTAVTLTVLLEQLKDFGYNPVEAEHIGGCVTELTRHFTKAENPLPKKMRKALEDERLTHISADAQTVKYADLCYNADWMMAYDRHHAKDYLQSKLKLIGEMTTGQAELRSQVLAQFHNVTIDGKRADKQRYDSLMVAKHPGDIIQVQLKRDNQVQTATVSLSIHAEKSFLMTQ